MFRVIFLLFLLLKIDPYEVQTHCLSRITTAYLKQIPSIGLFSLAALTKYLSNLFFFSDFIAGEKAPTPGNIKWEHLFKIFSLFVITYLIFKIFSAFSKRINFQHDDLLFLIFSFKFLYSCILLNNFLHLKFLIFYNEMQMKYINHRYFLIL